MSTHVASATERELGLPAGRVKVVPVGVDTEHFRPDPDARAAVRSRLGIAVEAPVLVLAIRLEREKGVDVALRAVRQLLARHADLRVLVAGAGHDERRLRRQAAHLRLEGVCTFLGPVDHDRLPAVMAGGDIFLLPSRCDEGTPVSLVEAGATGLPVVASRSEGIAGVVAHGTTGLLVPRGDADALAGAVLRLLDDDGMRRSMGERARQRAVSHWRAAAMVQVVERALAELMTHDAEGLRQ